MRQIKKGSTDRSAYIRIIDSTDGTPETGVVYNTSGIAMWYRREGATQTAITEATLSALDSAHSDGGIIHIGDGYYRLDLPDAAFATGANSVIVGGTVTGMIVIGEVIQLVNHDVEDGVRLGLTALPNAAADAAGGLPISDAGGLDLDTKLANTNEITATRMGYLDAAISTRSTLTASDVWGYATRTLSSFGTLVSDIWSAVTRTITGGTITTNSDKTGYSLSVTPPTAIEIRQEIDSNSTRLSDINGVTDKIDTAMQLDGAVYQFTTNALENAPSSSGGDATAVNQTIIISHLTDIKGSSFSGSTDSLEAIRDRGDVAWLTGSGASGSNTVTLTIHDTDDNNLIDVAVEIWDSAGTSFIERKNSNSSGISVFNLDDGTYTVKCHKAFYSFTNTTITVSGNLSHTIEGIAFVIPVPTNPDLCRVYCGLEDGLTFPTSANSEYQISGNFEIDNTYFSTFEKIGVYNPATGLLYFDLPQGATVVIDIPGYISGTYIIPASASARLKDLTSA